MSCANHEGQGRAIATKDDLKCPSQTAADRRIPTRTLVQTGRDPGNSDSCRSVSGYMRIARCPSGKKPYRPTEEREK